MTFERSISSPEIKSNNPIIMIALDIDDTLASPVNKDDLENDYISWFRDNDLIVDATEKHLLHPGVIEFIRYLYENPNIKFCFFSHGEAARNNLIVPLILKRALCDKNYKYALSEEEFNRYIEIIKENNIFSRRDCPDNKDLRKVTVKLGGDLNSIILVDDQRYNVVFGQKQNGLIINYADDMLFDHTSTKPLDDCHPKKWCSQSEMRSVNHIFYVTGLLEKLFSLRPKPILESLFELQYEEKGTEDNWLQKYGVALVTFQNRESLNISTLIDMSNQHNTLPVLIRLLDTNELVIFGKPNAKDWALTSLNPAFIGKLNFPWVNGKCELLDKEFTNFHSNEMYALSREIENKKGHTVINYEPKFELYKDKSLYLSGLQTLQQYASKPLAFYGHKANKFFLIQKDEVTVKHSGLWSVSRKTHKRKEPAVADSALSYRI